MKEKEELMADDPDFNVEEFIDQEYADPDAPAPEPKEEPAAEVKEEPEAKEEPAPADDPDNPVLPPGFKADEAKEEPETKEEADIELAEIDAAIEAETNENKKSNMARMRTKMQAQADRLAELEAKVGQEPADVSEYEKQLEEANNKIAQLDLKEDPRFKAKYDDRVRAVLADITDLVKPHFEEEGEAAKIVGQLANMSPVDRNKFMIDNDVPEHYRMELVQRYREADAVWGERNQALQNFEESRKALEMESTVQNQTQTAEVREAVFKEATAALQAKEPLLAQQPDNPEYNAFVAQRHQAARTVVESNDPKLQTQMMIQGSLMPTYKAMFELTQKQLVEAQAELKRYTGGKPDFNGGANPATKKGEGALPDNNDKLADFIVNS